ncbi:MAG: GntR family transcriptional regulator [Eubacteriales bacterium]
MDFDYSRFKLDKNTPLPMYYQIESYLSDNIANGQIAVGDCLPPETKLMEMFGVSRSVVRQAINELVVKDMVQREKGRGTFVKQPKIKDLSFQILDSFHDEMVKKGHVPRTKVLDFKRVSPLPEVNEKLGLSSDEPLLYLRRLRFVDDEPVLYFETYLPYERYAGLLEEDLERHSLYALLEEKYSSRVNRVIRRIEVANASKLEAGLLGIKKGDAIFLVSFIGFHSESIPTEYSVTRYRGDNNEFVVELRR